MESISEFFGMGGYAGFVWATYGSAALIMVGLPGAQFFHTHDQQAHHN